MAPLTREQIFWAKSSASVVRGLFVGLLTLGLGQIFYFLEQKQLLPIAHPGALLFFALCSGYAFAGLGLALGVFAKNFEHIGAMSSLVLLPLIYLGGVFFDLRSLPPFWQFLAGCNPLFYTIDGIRYGMLGTSTVRIFFAAGVNFLFFVICYILALVSLKKGFRYLR